MTVYRVGDAGATVFDAAGKPLARLQPGCTVVEGTEAQHRAAMKLVADELARLSAQDDPKRRTGYADKRVRPAEDKAVGWGSVSSPVPDGSFQDEHPTEQSKRIRPTEDKAR